LLSQIRLLGSESSLRTGCRLFSFFSLSFQPALRVRPKPTQSGSKKMETGPAGDRAR
jgi:hypothetical protein